MRWRHQLTILATRWRHQLTILTTRWRHHRQFWPLDGHCVTTRPIDDTTVAGLLRSWVSNMKIKSLDVLEPKLATIDNFGH